MNKNIAELIGTFTLVFVGTATAVVVGLLGDQGMGNLAVAFAFGVTLMVLVNTIGPISGCHINPAVTIVMFVAKKIKLNTAIGYIVAQMIGATLASVILRAAMNGVTGYDAATHGLGANGLAGGSSVSSTLIFEVVLTALFLFVIFNATSAKANPQVAGLSIGGYLLVVHMIGVPLGDASLNPARSLGPAILQGGTALAEVWVFIVGPIIGALLGHAIYRAVAEE
ncbi:MAG: aquaporin [Acidobacteriota bacterium]|nr:aquaporin [Acidobacteriota bacterium]